VVSVHGSQYEGRLGVDEEQKDVVHVPLQDVDSLREAQVDGSEDELESIHRDLRSHRSESYEHVVRQ
jgi:hypothetical protein